MPDFCSGIFGAGFPESVPDGKSARSGLLALEIFFGDPVEMGFSAVFIKDSALTERILTYEEVRNLITEANDLGVVKIVFSGKDVFLFPYMNDVISYSESLGIEAAVIKNDYRLPEYSASGGHHCCERSRYSCVVTSYGYVLPCPGLPLPLGNVLYQKFSDIIKDSEILSDLKYGADRIKGRCGSCQKIRSCFGCRGRAYAKTGDYLAPDPLCGENRTCEEDIVSLPLPVDRIIPQMPPMRIIDTIDELAERSALCSARIKEEIPFMEKDGSIDGVAYLEMIAQSIAALNGFRNMDSSGEAPEGYLLGAKNLKIKRKALAGETLKIMVFKFARYGGFGIVKGIVKKDDEILAEGEIKIWHKTDE
jgi:predicted hotdog family 3-hydroxylacyl-ACP dehydratase